jgi:hypothetical protein
VPDNSGYHSGYHFGVVRHSLTYDYDSTALSRSAGEGSFVKHPYYLAILNRTARFAEESL